MINLGRSDSLTKQIKRFITYRVSLCLLLLTITVFFLSIYDVYNSFSLMQRGVRNQCAAIKDFIISQSLIGNDTAIQARLDQLNHANSAVNFAWVKTEHASLSDKMKWVFPWQWNYYYPVVSFDNAVLGYLKVYGSFLFDKGLFLQFFIRVLLLFAFSMSMFFLLYPLAKKIPRLLIVEPINELLSLIKIRENRAGHDNFDIFPSEINEIKEKLISLFNEIEEKTRENAFSQIASQVVHDIRSPLASLNMVLPDIKSMQEDQRVMVRRSIQRIMDIANNLLSRYRQNKADNVADNVSSEPIIVMLEAVLSEKRAQFDRGNVCIDLQVENTDAWLVFAKVNESEFKRVISNLLGNAIESLDNESEGKVIVLVKKISDRISIDIQDNGCGIPQYRLDLVLQEGISIGKKGGSGLGLPYAVNKIYSWNGDYSITSEVDVGTHFNILLPISKPAAWFKESILLRDGIKVVVLDDDEYIHDIWRSRFCKYIDNDFVKLFNLFSPSEIKKFCASENITNTIFLLDYELIGCDENGLSIAKALGIEPYATLVTHRYDDVEIREKCLNANIKIIPKEFASKTLILKEPIGELIAS